MGFTLKIRLLTVVVAIATCRVHFAGASEPESPEGLALRHGFDGAFFTDMNHGYVFGNDAIIATSDGGTNWRLVRAGGRIESAFFLDSQTLWVLYVGGALYASADGGQTFSNSRPKFIDPTTAQSEPICGRLFFLDASRGWTACGNQMLKTTDGGQDWTVIVLPRAAAPRSVLMVDSARGIATTVHGLLLYTSDGGTAWFEVPNSPHLEQLSCTAMGFCAGLGSENGPIFLSSDGGQTWEDTQAPIQPANRDRIRQVKALSPALLLAVGSDVGLSYLEDVKPYVGTGTFPATSSEPRAIILKRDGPTWTRLTPDGPQSLSGLYFVDGQHGWLTGSEYNLLYRTDDGGASLTFVPDYFRQIAALTPSPTPFVFPTPSP